LRAPGLEELRDAREPAGDVAGLVDLAGDLGERGAGLDDVAVADGQLRADRDDELPDLLIRLRVPDLDHRVELLLAIVGDHELAPAGRLVELLADGLLLDDVDEDDLPGAVGHDRLRVRVPAEEQVAGLDLLAVLDGERRAVGHGQAAPDRTIPGQHDDLALAARDDPLAGRRLDRGDAVEGDLPVDLGLAVR